MLEENGLITRRTVSLIRQTEPCSCFWKPAQTTSIITVIHWKPVWSPPSPRQAPPRAPSSSWQLIWSPTENWQVRHALGVYLSVLWKIVYICQYSEKSDPFLGKYLVIRNISFWYTLEKNKLLLAVYIMKVLVAQLCPVLRYPMDCSLPGSSVHGIVQARILEWVAIPFSRGSSWSRDWTWIPCIAGRFFTIWATREALILKDDHII